MKTIRNNWKVALIVAAGIVAVILLCVFGVQSSQNRAFALEEALSSWRKAWIFPRMGILFKTFGG